jgi:hypothetical protein
MQASSHAAPTRPNFFTRPTRRLVTDYNHFQTLGVALSQGIARVRPSRSTSPMRSVRHHRRGLRDEPALDLDESRRKTTTPTSSRTAARRRC